MSPWAKPQSGSAPGTGTSKLEELARLPGVSPQLAALLQDKERIQDILAKDPAARSALARAAGAPAGKAIEELRGILGRYLGERADAAESIANSAYAKQKDIAALKREWKTIKTKLVAKMTVKGGAMRTSPYAEYVYTHLPPFKTEWEIDKREIARFQCGLDPQDTALYDLMKKVGGVDLLADAGYPKPLPPKDHVGNGEKWRLFVGLFKSSGSVKGEDWAWGTGEYLDMFGQVVNLYTSRWRGWKDFCVTRGQIEQLDVRIDAMCDKAQIEIDELNQEFKNEMHMVNSARGDLRDLSRDITSLGKGL